MSRSGVSLRDEQLWFAGAVITRASLDEAERRLTAGPKLGPRERLAVYVHGYQARLVECLADDYPVLQRAMGEEAFGDLCRAYIARHPSRSPSLNAYGCHLPEMCEPGFARDLARLEWALVEVIHQPAGEPLTMDQLATIPMEAWAKARLLPCPALRVLATEYPANDYFQAVRDGHAPPLPGPAASAVVVYRSGRSVWRMGLNPAMRGVLEALIAGQPLEAALSLAGDEPPERVTTWFREWVSSGLFVGIDVG